MSETLFQGSYLLHCHHPFPSQKEKEASLKVVCGQWSLPTLLCSGWPLRPVIREAKGEGVLGLQSLPLGGPDPPIGPDQGGSVVSQ